MPPRIVFNHSDTSQASIIKYWFHGIEQKISNYSHHKENVFWNSPVSKYKPAWTYIDTKHVENGDAETPTICV